MDLQCSREDEQFRDQLRAWLAENLAGEHELLRGRAGSGDQDALIPERLAWERVMAGAGWTCIGWPSAHGGRDATLTQEVIFHEEYARARAPGRISHIGEGLLGPTLIAMGSEEQKRRFLPPIAAVDELWCQGYSEPAAGSDLAAVQTRAELVGGEWIIHGQKIWTSNAHIADWCFVLCRTDPGAARHKGISYLLVPMRQAGVEVRPIRQMTGTAEFCEVFFDGARTGKDNVVGAVNDGWRVAMTTLLFERGASTLGQQLGFQIELEQIIAVAKQTGAARDPLMRQRLADSWIKLTIMRANALRMLADARRGELSRAGMINKLYWSHWHRDLGMLAMDVLGPRAEIIDGPPYELSLAHKMYLFSRADTIYAGSSQIQRTIIGERALGLPREPRGDK